MITVISGLPGAGKTLRAVWLAQQLAKDGSQVYELGIRDCDHVALGIKPYPGELSDWMTTLAPKDVLIVDEVQRWLPNRPASQKPPNWIEELTRNRHYGVDMIFITQDPMNLDAFVRRLVNVHEHLINIFGGDKAKLYRWEQVQDVGSKGLKTSKKSGDDSTWKYPKEIYDLYKSADLHTRKKYTPGKIKQAYFWVAVCVICIGVAVGAVMHMRPSSDVKPDVAKSKPDAQVLPVKPASQFASIDKAKPIKTKAEWVAQFVPRVDGLPWSEPAFDERKVSTNPEVYCMSIEHGPCICQTEQGTRFPMDQAQCGVVAKFGVYNPFRRVLEHREIARIQTEYDENRAQAKSQEQATTIPGSGSSGQNAFDKAAHAPRESSQDTRLNSTGVNAFDHPHAGK